ncbi:iron-containing alcohol dehydrogenase [Nocardioides sp. zg-1228]|uniref:iron-containing alcohol dehydrogenase n=1 Tax=Nocardioides sp. zg-1228 TaxID=2763008 RepID=UPI001642D09D|nr:iron-containing alcohol dehydrogenase [Nocardioides sp. zg-1228]MBC2932565.1 iron-containing alcohol dehydrogenase [Nocardioides sp. zg-1228]QSF58062.1 iron-containing alcohol dehydrogenase [Nocardioides sp. zg-1228]
MSLLGVLRGPRQVLFGAGQRHALATVTAALGSRALVCTDARFGATAEFAQLVGLLEQAGVHVTTFAEVEPDVPVHQVTQCAQLAAAARPDVVVGMGGGSCLDLAKAVAVLLAHGGSPADYYGELRVPGPVVPVVALPTTAGTGSEVTPVAVLTDPDRVSKVGISSPHLIPQVAVCDPELTLGCPPGLTASAGADALSHVVEAFTAVRRPLTTGLATERVFVGKNELTDTYALLGVRLIAGSLHRAWSTPDDVEAREAMMLGATAGGFALGTAGTAAAHAIQYPVGALTHTPHGIGVGALLPYVMEYNRPARVAEMAAIAVAMGASPDASAEDLADEAIDRVAALLASVGIPATLAEIGLPADQLRWTAEQASGAERLVANNPRPLDVDGLERIVRAAHSGDRAALRDAVLPTDDLTTPAGAR